MCNFFHVQAHSGGGSNPDLFAQANNTLSACEILHLLVCPSDSLYPGGFG